jgi:hypothetical protein
LAENTEPIGRRTRIAFGVGVVVASLLVATAIVGVGFAGGSITAAEYQYGKVTICHHTHSKKHTGVTITISRKAWPAHQRHGDTMGACTGTASTGKGHGHGHDNAKGGSKPKGHDASSKGHGNGHGKGGDDGKTTSTPTSTTATPTAPTPTHGNGNGNGHGNGGGNGGDNGSTHGHGHK